MLRFLSNFPDYKISFKSFKQLFCMNNFYFYNLNLFILIYVIFITFNCCNKKTSNISSNQNNMNSTNEELGGVYNYEETGNIKSNLSKIADDIKSGKIQKVIIMTGAGISRSCGIPDFRSKNGLFDLVKKEYPKFKNNPTDIFQITAFKEDKGKGFYKVMSKSNKILGDKVKPSKTHFFFKLLETKGILHRYYTQNIDVIEYNAGLSHKKIINAHGNFKRVYCFKCKKDHCHKTFLNKVKKGEVYRCSECEGIIRPSVVFYGEQLAQEYYNNFAKDFSECDLLIVIGTSLEVSPFNELISKVSQNTPRLLFNMNKVGTSLPGGFNFEHENSRDIFISGKCDETITKFVNLLGWSDDLSDLIKSY